MAVTTDEELQMVARFHQERENQVLPMVCKIPFAQVWLYAHMIKVQRILWIIHASVKALETNLWKPQGDYLD